MFFARRGDLWSERAAVSALWYTSGNRYFYSHSSGIQSNRNGNNASSKCDTNYHAGSYTDTIRLS
jgi:hypothetical protein